MIIDDGLAEKPAREDNYLQGTQSPKFDAIDPEHGGTSFVGKHRDAPVAPLERSRSLVPYSVGMLLKATPIRKADEAVHSFNELYCLRLETLDRRMRTRRYETLTSVYGAVHFLVTNDLEKPFLESRGVERHHKVENPYQPLVKAFVKGCHPDVRDRLCKDAEVVAVGIFKKKEPHEFLGWLKRTTLSRGVEEYRQAKKEFCASIRPKDPVAEEQRRIEREAEESRVFVDESVPWQEGTQVTKGHTGFRRLTVTEFDPNGSGRHRTLGVLPHEHRAVMRIVLAAARASKAARRRRQ